MSVVISGAVKRQQLGAIDQQLLRRPVLFVAEVVAEPVRGRFEHGERARVGHLLRRVGPARRERNLDDVAALLGGFLDPGATAEHDQVRKRNLLAATLRGLLKSFWIFS